MQILVHKRIKEFHRRCGKRNNGKCFVEKTLEKRNISPNLNKSSNTEKLFYLRNKILSEDSLKTSKHQRLRHFSNLTQKVILQKTTKTEGSLEAKQCHEIASSGISANNAFQYHHCRTRYTEHNGCGLSNENKPGEMEDSKYLADESLCLKRSRKSDFQTTSLPSITRERFTERRNCQDIGQCLVRKLTSIKHTKIVQATKQFCCHQGGKCFTHNSYFNEHTKIHLEGKQHCCHEC